MHRLRSLISNYFKSDNVYQKILFTLVILICVTILVTSMSLYIAFENIVQYQIFVSENENLSQASYSADVLFTNATMAAKQVYYDRRISILRIYNDINIDEISNILTDFGAYKYHNDSISSIYIYNGRSKTLATAAFNYSGFDSISSFYDKEALEFIRNFPDYPCMTPIPRKIPVWSSQTQNVFSDGYTFIFYENPGTTANLDSAVILNIDESWMRQTVNQLSPGLARDTYIIDGTGKTIINSNRYSMLEDLSGKPHIVKILAQNDLSGYFIDEIDGVKSLIIYAPYKKLGWTYVRTISYDLIMNKVNELRRTTIIIVIAIFAAALLIAFLQSGNLYRPIGKAMSKLNKLETEKRKSYLSRRQEFLKKLLQGRIRVGSDEYADMCKEFNLNLAPENEFMLLLFAIDGYKAFCDYNSLEDRSLCKFGSMNIVSELFSEAYLNEAVDADENIIVLILNRSLAAEAFCNEKVRSIVQDAQLRIEEYLNISLSCFISHTFIGVNKIPQIYDELFYSSNYKLLYGKKCVLFSSALADTRNTEYSYPLKNEKILLEALIAGNANETKQVFNEIIDKASKCSYSFFILTVNRLIFAILGALTDTAAGHGLHISINHLIDEINRLESLEDIKSAFYKIFDDLETRAGERKKQKHDAITEKIILMIHEKYNDPNLSIQMIGDSLNFSSGYTGLLFKQSTGKSIVDYINEVRIMKAKSLLMSTNLSVNEIYEKTGFTNAQYFRKVFRKNFGISPSEMRRDH